VPLGPGRGQVAPPVTHAVNARIVPSRTRIPTGPKRVLRVAVTDQILEEKDDYRQSEMEVEDDAAPDYDEEELLVNEQEVEAMIGFNESEADEEEQDKLAPLPPATTKPPRVWPEVPTERAQKYKKEIQSVRERFEDDVDLYDTTMVSEYAEEIFEYMCDLEVCLMPWSAVLMDA